MSIKDFIKTRAPRSFLPFLRSIYWCWPIRKLRKFRARKALQYLPYYQDDLSREILSDRLAYIGSHDRNIFLDRAEKIGMKFHGIFWSAPSGYYWMSPEGSKYSGIVMIYDNKGLYFRYAQRLLSSCDWKDKYRLMTLKDFLNGAEIHDSELIVLVLTSAGKAKFTAKRKQSGIKASVFGDIIFSTREDLQYFDVFTPVDDEVVVNAGAYNGATAIQFLEWGKGKVKHVYSFEFDPINAAMCEENLKPYSDKVTLVKKGTWDHDEVIHVSATGGSGSNLNSKGNTEVHLTTIDSVVQDEHVTFIKMDIEGAELKSLMGARNTIIKNHPRLAICVYHKNSDLYEIPGYILSLVPEYRFYLRHYCSIDYETVLYAYCE